MSKSYSVKGNLVDVWKQEIYPAEVVVEGSKIVAINAITVADPSTLPYILPGFVDSHVHVESSMLIPSEFARLAVVHGTVATISDPHEIANVNGMEGVEFMIENGKKVNFKFNFGAPSCVPATIFETAGATVDSADIETLMSRPEILYLSEMMNFPGVLFKDEEVMKKIAIAHKYNKPVDGHAPGLRGSDAKKYIDAGISTDHECFTAEEALDKLQYGMKILIREGSAAKNFEALIGLLEEHYKMMMFCSDDKHPDSLAIGHINQLCARAVAKGIDIFKIIQVACVNPVLHYKMKVGLLRVGDDADFVLAKDLIDFNIIQTYINGELMAEDGKSFIQSVKTEPINNFSCHPVTEADLKILTSEYPKNDAGLYPVMEALDGQLITNKLYCALPVMDNELVSDTTNDYLKMIVVNRYNPAPVAKCFIKNFGLTKGALASSVAHDSHNIVAVGVDDASLVAAINLVIKERGGVSAASPLPLSEGEGKEDSLSWKTMVLGLPVAGLMSAEDGYKVAADYTAIDKMTKEDLGSKLGSPFMTLSFMALLVIPHLKLSDKGLFDGDTFQFVC